jgi:hypothetical protein
MKRKFTLAFLHLATRKLLIVSLYKLLKEENKWWIGRCLVYTVEDRNGGYVVKTMEERNDG